MSRRWRGVLAALTNPDLRAVLAEAMTAPPLPDARRRRAIARLSELGLVRATPSGTLSFDEATVRSILAEERPVKPSGVARFLDADGRIDLYPAQHGDRVDLLAWVADQAFSADDALAETEVNERLERFTTDVAVLRRYLVDTGILERTSSGSQYRLAAVSPR
jgi:hypothetical protein